MGVKLNYNNTDFDVNRGINETIYAGLKSDAHEQTHDAVIRYYLSNREKFFPKGLIEFLKKTGIDWTKENEIYHYPSTDNQLIIEGWFDIVGVVLNNEKVISFYFGDEMFTTNVLFSNDIRHGLCPEFSNYRTFRFDFAIILHEAIRSL